MKIKRLFQVVLASSTLAFSVDIVKTSLATGYKQNEYQLPKVTQVADALPSSKAVQIPVDAQVAQVPSMPQPSPKSSTDLVSELVLIALMLTFGLSAIKQIKN